MNSEQFIQTVNQIHNWDYDKYDYSVCHYNGYDKKISVICNKHKYAFWITASNHLDGEGCPKCKEENNDNNNN